MSMTSAFIEIVVIGVQGLLWLSLLTASVLGFDAIKAIQPVLRDSPGSLSAIVLLSIVYTVGVLIDRIGDGLFVLLKPRDVLLRIAAFRQWADMGHTDEYLRVFLSDGKASSMLEYIRSRVRIVRSSLFNFFMIMISSLVLMHTRCDSITLRQRFFLTMLIVPIGTVALAVVFVCWGMLEITWERRLGQANQALEDARRSE